MKLKLTLLCQLLMCCMFYSFVNAESAKCTAAKERCEIARLEYLGKFLGIETEERPTHRAKKIAKTLINYA